MSENKPMPLWSLYSTAIAAEARGETRLADALMARCDRQGEVAKACARISRARHDDLRAQELGG